MNADLTFVCGVAATLGICFVVVHHLRRPLFKILIHLCETEERAQFWTAFSTVTLVCVPTILALGRYPASATGESAVLRIGSQLQSGLIGMVVTVVTLGIVLSLIPRRAA
jgi:hypothetical protein